MISDVCKSFQFKQWWTFRSKSTLQGDFLKAKYYQRSNPVSKKWDTSQSLVWKHMMQNKHEMEPHIHWKLNFGSCSFQWDNRLGMGPLAQFRGSSSRRNNTKVATFIQNGQWDVDLIINTAPPQHIAAILATPLQIQNGIPDKTLWKMNSMDCSLCLQLGI